MCGRDIITSEYKTGPIAANETAQRWLDKESRGLSVRMYKIEEPPIPQETKDRWRVKETTGRPSPARTRHKERKDAAPKGQVPTGDQRKHPRDGRVRLPTETGGRGKSQPGA